MRLIKHLNEEVKNGKWYAEEIRKNVAPSFRNAIHDVGNFLYRGTSRKIPEIETFSVRDDRRPFSTDLREHEIIDEIFNKKFGWKVRSNSVFASSNEFEAEVYGESYIFFPIKKYRFVWSPKVRDLWGTLGAIRKEVLAKRGIGIFSKRPHLARETWFIKEWIEGGELKKHFEPVIKQYTDKNLQQAIRQGVEVAFNCKNYFLVNRKYEDILAEEFLD